MREVALTVSRPFPIDLMMISADNKPTFVDLTSRLSRFGRTLVIVDKAVQDQAGAIVEDFLRALPGEFSLHAVECSEKQKGVDLLSSILEKIDEFSPDRRREPVIAIGGGVLLDSVGFACSQYRRGIPYVRIPTSLIGQVDVSVAAKTGINFAGKRNRIGSFYPPFLTVLDPRFLRTVSDVDISSGFGEIIKIAVIADGILFDRLWKVRSGLSRDLLLFEKGSAIIWYAARKMLEILVPNYWEDDLMRSVDFGHSFSPMIEMEQDSHLTHGAAVGLDVLLSCQISVDRGLLAVEDMERTREMLISADLPVWHPSFANVDKVWEALQDTMSHRAGNQHLPIPNSIGHCVFVEDLTYSELAVSIKKVFG